MEVFHQFRENLKGLKAEVVVGEGISYNGILGEGIFKISLIFRWAVVVGEATVRRASTPAKSRRTTTLLTEAPQKPG